MPCKIAIVGGGPCGLTLARLLECKGIDYIVYEQEESDAPNRRGGTLDIHVEDGQKALREADLWDEFKKYARWEDDVFTLLDSQSKQWLRFGDESGGGNDGGRPEIDRLALRKILLNSIPGDKVQWGFSLKAVSHGEDEKPVLQFASGSTASGFDLVVGTDGAWSKVRPSVSYPFIQSSCQFLV